MKRIEGAARGKVSLLASQAEAKINATIGAIRVAFPLETESRRFIVVRDEKISEPNEPRSIMVYESIEGARDEPLSPATILYSGRYSTGLLKGVISDETFEGNTGDMVIYAQDSLSFINPQPIKEHDQYKRDEGFQGSFNRVNYLKELNKKSEEPIDYDHIVGIENAIVVFDEQKPEETIQKIKLDIGFVRVENRDGQVGRASSTGIILGEDDGTRSFYLSAGTNFQKPAGHFYSPEDPQNPHTKATKGMYDRATLLTPAVAIALKQASI